MSPAGSGVLTRAGAAELDASDPLRAYPDRFAIDPEVVYLDGNSLGCLAWTTLERLHDVVALEWGARG